MKNILLVGSSSDASKDLFNTYKRRYNFIRLSSDESESDITNFNVLNPDSYYLNEKIKYDGLVYFPGSINLKPFKNLKTDDFYNDFDINVMGLVKVLKFYQPYFNKHSSLIFISSLASKIGMPFHASVSVSKSALVGLCISLAAEFAPYKRVNCISPSIFKSKMAERFLRSEQSEERIKNNNPLKKIGETKDIVCLINFLLSDESKWITGQNISIDGGMSTLRL
tara:strand:+ start:1220 stop:1891 length:672 start_codon:yes stop_codon:yes gene_type:complete